MGTDMDQSRSKNQKFTTSLHFFKRDLTPLRENYAQCNEKTPYKQNFQNYEGSLMSKELKDGLLTSLG